MGSSLLTGLSYVPVGEAEVVVGRRTLIRRSWGGGVRARLGCARKGAG